MIGLVTEVVPSFVLQVAIFFCSLTLLQVALPCFVSSLSDEGQQNRAELSEGLEGQNLEHGFESTTSSSPGQEEELDPNHAVTGHGASCPFLDPLPLEPMTLEQYTETYHAFERHINRHRELFPTTHLGKAWKFVEALQQLVADFERTYRNAPAPPLFGNSVDGPHYEAMLRRFYSQNDEPKLHAVDQILEEYKGKEATLFQELAAIYVAPDPLEVFRAKPRSSTSLLPQSSAPVAGPTSSSAATVLSSANHAGTMPIPTTASDSALPTLASSLRPHPSVFGPGFYESMLRNFNRRLGRPSFDAETDALARYKGREGELFQHLSIKYAAPNPLSVYLASFSSPLLLPSAPATRTPTTTMTSAAVSAPRQHQPLGLTSASPIQTVSTDDMVFLAERLFEAQERFRSEGEGQRPHSIDIGYHYTKPEYLDRIKTDGLLNQQERKSQQISSSYNGSRYGEGIYTADDPQSFSDFGPVGLIVLRLKGVEKDAEEANRGYASGNNSIVSKKRRGLVVLEKCNQCLPVIHFLADDMSTNQGGLAHLKYLERKVQCLVEQHFNASRSKGNDCLVRKSGLGKTKRNKRSSVCRPLAMMPSTHETIVYEAPLRLTDIDNSELNLQRFYDVVGLQRFHNDDCSICLNQLSHHGGSFGNIESAKVVRLKVCGHEFHEGCAQRVLVDSILCPICRRPQQEVRGKMPSGTMTISYSESQHCEGYEYVGTIIIRYVIPSGTQKIYHESPGQTHADADRTAYIPRTLDGIRLVSRLKYAFQRGLTFTVGTSITNGKRNCVTWSTIHHKTCLSGGTSVHGYPDPTFFYRCNQELTDAGVP